MIYPVDCEQWIGRFIVLDWNLSFTGTTRKIPKNSGGRALRVDDTYLYLQPFGLAEPSAAGESVSKLGLKIEEEKIPLVDIQAIYAAPLDGIQIVE